MHISLLGTGLMGSAIGERLLASGHRVTAWNRTLERAAALAAHGAEVADTPAAALARTECVLLALSDADAVESALLGGESRTHLIGRSVVQMGTIAPAESRELSARVLAGGGEYLECPVLGSLPEARAGRLILMAGGEADALERVRPLLECLGPGWVHVGPVGQAAALKLAMNQLIGSLTAAFAVSLGLVQREGVPVETFMEVLRASALYAPTFDKKLPRMLERDFGRPNFPLKHLFKDLRLFSAAAGDDELDTTLTRAVERILDQGLAADLGEADYSALYATVVPPHRAGDA